MSGNNNDYRELRFSIVSRIVLSTLTHFHQLDGVDVHRKVRIYFPNFIFKVLWADIRWHPLTFVILRMVRIYSSNFIFKVLWADIHIGDDLEAKVDGSGKEATKLNSLNTLLKRKGYQGLLACNYGFIFLKTTSKQAFPERTSFFPLHWGRGVCTEGVQNSSLRFKHQHQGQQTSNEETFGVETFSIRGVAHGSTRKIVLQYAGPQTPFVSGAEVDESKIASAGETDAGETGGSWNTFPEEEHVFFVNWTKGLREVLEEHHAFSWVEQKGREKLMASVSTQPCCSIASLIWATNSLIWATNWRDRTASAPEQCQQVLGEKHSMDTGGG